jgi:hypothetical protein
MTERRTLIEGRVAKILNSRELVINRGAQDGVELGMRFAVLEPKGEDVADPETGEILGSVNRPKVSVEVVDLKERLAVVRTFRIRSRNVGGSGSPFDYSGILGRTILGNTDPPRWVRVPETFKTDETTWEDISEEESFVKVGDPVREVAGEGDRGG